MYNILSDSKQFVKSSVVDAKHLNFIIGTEKKLTNLVKELKTSEANSEIDLNLNQEVPALVFYMAFAKLIKRTLTNVHHLDLFYRQSKLRLTM